MKIIHNPNHRLGINMVVAIIIFTLLMGPMVKTSEKLVPEIATGFILATTLELIFILTSVVFIFFVVYFLINLLFPPKKIKRRGIK